MVDIQNPGAGDCSPGAAWVPVSYQSRTWPTVRHRVEMLVEMVGSAADVAVQLILRRTSTYAERCWNATTGVANTPAGGSTWKFTTRCGVQSAAIPRITSLHCATAATVQRIIRIGPEPAHVFVCAVGADAISGAGPN